MTKTQKLEKIIKNAIIDFCKDDTIGVSALTEVKKCPYCQRDLFKIKGLGDYIAEALNKNIKAIREIDNDFEIIIESPVDGVEVKGE